MDAHLRNSPAAWSRGCPDPWPVFCLTAAAVLLASLLAACSAALQVTGAATTPATPSAAGLTGIHKIQHVIIIMQENRSFDSYFGTYPGAAGIPMSNGVPSVCVPNPRVGVSARSTTPLMSTAVARTG